MSQKNITTQPDYRLGSDALAGLGHIRIVLLNTYHAGNIGAAARAMKTMGLSDLVLVNPRDYPSDEATNRAAGAVDVLEAARVLPSLQEAIADCHWVVATSARKRGFDWPLLPFEQAMSDAAGKLHQSNDSQKIAILFGGERSGLTNDELQCANVHAFVSANPEYPVLNLASAVQLACYELRKALENAPQKQQEKPHPTQQEVQYLFDHLEQALTDTGYINAKHSGDVMVKLKRFFIKANLEKEELAMWRGILTRMNSK